MNIGNSNPQGDIPDFEIEPHNGSRKRARLIVGIGVLGSVLASIATILLLNNNISQNSPNIIPESEAQAAVSSILESELGTGQDSVTTEASASTSTVPATNTIALEPSATGSVTISSGDPIRIGSINALTGDIDFLGLPNHRAISLAVADYGPILGFDVAIGESLDSFCSADGGGVSAEIASQDSDLLGVIGTTCSGAAFAASPIISQAGLVMISPSNTSPDLTSDLNGSSGTDHYPGYYRTGPNDLTQAIAGATFAYEELGLRSVTVVHDGDPYTDSIGTAFVRHFARLGGTTNNYYSSAPETEDFAPLLAEIAANPPDLLFFPLFLPQGGLLVEQVRANDTLSSTVLMTTDGLLTDSFLSQPQSQGIYITSTHLVYDDNTSVTGQSSDDVLQSYIDAYGETPSAAFWAHSYDATTLLLRAIEAVALEQDGSLIIDRQALRDQLDSAPPFDGISGTIGCDDYGDCGSQQMEIIQVNSTDPAVSRENVIYLYDPPR